MAIPKWRLSVATFAAAFALSAPAYAGVRTTEVQVSDLDLSRPSAQEQLKGRIERAVRKVCRSDLARNLGERNDIVACETDARAKSEEQMMQRIAEHRAVRTQAMKSRLRVAAD